MAFSRLERLDLERLDRLPAMERGITIGDFLVPVPIGERMGLRPYHLGVAAAGAGLITLGTFVSVPVPGSPTPVTGQTLAVLVVGAALGVRRGLLAVLFYLALGIAGVPDFAEQRAGAEVIATVRDGRLILGSAGGYLLGFMLAAAASGRLAELGWDRKVGRALVTMTVGSLLIYLVGVPWLMAAEDLAVGEAIRLGLLPYLLGDLVKIVLAAAILPAAWWVVGRRPVAS